MSRSTRAAKILDDAGISYSSFNYEHHSLTGNLGLHAAKAIGVPAAELFKTLLFELDDRTVVALAPSDRSVSAKLLAAALGGKRAALASAEAAERISGYHIGGISPLGMRRTLAIVMDDSADSFVQICVNGGQRGLQLQIDVADLKRVTGAVIAPICMPL